MSPKTTGLVLGKFAPLHKGHQFLIEYARERVNKLYVLVYEDGGISGIPLTARANWIRNIYPKVIVIEGHNSPIVEGNSAEIMKIQEDYILSMIPEVITDFFSSEWYGEHVAAALGARDCRVDPARVNVPISATAIRADRFLAPKFLAPTVNRDFVKKVVFLGGESTGKSTLCEACAELYNTKFVGEYGRDFWLANRDENGKLTANQLVQLAQNHIANEEAQITLSSGICFIDTNAFITKLFCEHYGLKVPEELDKMISLEQYRYDLFIVCADDIPFIQDGTRNDEKLRKEFQKKITNHLKESNIRYYIVYGNLEKRLIEIRGIIAKEFGIFPSTIREFFEKKEQKITDFSLTAGAERVE